MQDFPLFKLSRYFFALFLIITVLPLVSLLIWSNFQLGQSLLNRQKQFLEMDTRQIHQIFQQQLSDERQAIAETAQSVRNQRLNLAEYKGIFNVNDIMWLDSPEAQAFLARQPQANTALKTAKHHLGNIIGDYFPAPKAIKSYFLVPLHSQHRGLILIKNTPGETFAPHGPYRVSIYAGSKPNPDELVFHADFMWHRPGSSPGFNSSIGLQKGAPAPLSDSPSALLHDTAPHGLTEPNSSPPPSLTPPEPGYDPKRSKVVAEKIIHLTNRVGVTVATIDLKALTPPHPPDAPFSRNSQWIGLLILSTGILTSLLAGHYLRKNFIEPLTHLAQVATNVQEGDLSSRVETDGIKQADVRETLNKVNAMLIGLAEKEQLRNSFISNLTHDFRTPLVAQRRSLELLAQDMQQLQLAQQEKLALGMLKNSEHLLTMVNQLLETYQSEARSFKLKLNREAVPELVSQCFQQLSPLAEERQITLSQQFPSDFPELMVDSYYLKRVLINLLGNAIENIPKKSEIQVSGQCPTPGRVEIHVKDNGLGLSPEEQRKVFERYYAGTGDTRKLGSGLGLYICAVLVNAHQGKISVDSVEGQYTDFIIDLPISSQERPL